MKPWLLCTLAVALLTPVACRRADSQAALAAQQAAGEQAAGEAGKAFDAAVAQQNWALAKAQADVLLAQYPGTRSAERVRAQFGEVKAKADAAREQSRTAALWSYNVEPVKGGTQLSAAIYARDDIDVDGSGAKQVRLIFRDHPSWGRSAYLVLQAGDFNCYGGCKVKMTVDDAAPEAMAASRPKTDAAIAMFIEDERALWRLTRGAKVIRIEFPVKPSGTRTAVFEVGGLDRAKLPGWD
ncbi:MAG TPA: hypothetical protein VHF02_02415 [Luteimonas sp.]|nr:hypothetical protein [Luteimonas sp.]